MDSVLRVVTLAGVLVAIGCGGAPEPIGHPPGAIKNPQQQETVGCYYTGINGSCGLNSCSPGPGGGSGNTSYGTINCGNRENLQIEVCMWQLVTGGWEQMNWTCRTASSPSGDPWSNIGVASNAVPYFTNGRWYQTWAWGYANGSQVALWSPTCKGDGGNGCW
jgi:hypothetical protein